MMGTGATKTGCMVFQPVSWSKKDTIETVMAVKEHNAVWRAICS